MYICSQKKYLKILFQIMRYLSLSETYQLIIILAKSYLYSDITCYIFLLEYNIIISVLSSKDKKKKKFIQFIKISPKKFLILIAMLFLVYKIT